MGLAPDGVLASGEVGEVALQAAAFVFVFAGGVSIEPGDMGGQCRVTMRPEHALGVEAGECVEDRGSRS